MQTQYTDNFQSREISFYFKQNYLIMPLTPEQVYLQSIDKQRILIIGDNASKTTELIISTLKHYSKHVDYILGNQIDLGIAPILIIEDSKWSDEMLKYRHHVLIITSKASSEFQKSLITKCVALTPKSGIVIYDGDYQKPDLTIDEMPDIAFIPYKIYAHEITGNVTTLLTSSSGKVPIQLSGSQNLKNISAAKEVLKRIGISSSQFYKWVTTIQ